jgi:hypothetical protein
VTPLWAQCAAAAGIQCSSQVLSFSGQCNCDENSKRSRDVGQQRTSCLVAFLIAFACALAALAAFFRAFFSCRECTAFVVSQIQGTWGSTRLHKGRALSSESGSGRWSCLQMTAHLFGGLLRLPARLLGLLAQLLGNAVATVGALCGGNAVPQQSGDNAAAVAALGSGDAML